MKASSYIDKIKADIATEAKQIGVYCPKCGGSSGFYHKAMYSHTQHIGFSGEASGCDVEYVRGGKKKYCSDCEKDITDFVDSLGLR